MERIVVDSLDEEGETIKPSQISDLDIWINNIVINHDGKELNFGHVTFKGPLTTSSAGLCWERGSRKHRVQVLTEARDMDRMTYRGPTERESLENTHI